MTRADMEKHAVSHEQAASLHQAGRIAEAAAMYRDLLEQHPQDAELLILFGMAQFQLGREDEARKAWRKSLAVEAPAPTKLRAIANMMMAGGGKVQFLDFVVDLTVPDWPQGVAPSPNDRHMIIALARGLVTHKRVAAALKLLDSVLPNLEADTVKVPEAIMLAADQLDSDLPDHMTESDFVICAAAIMLDAGNADKVAAILRPWTSRPGAVDTGLIVVHAAAAHRAGHQKESRDLVRRVAEAVPIHLTAKEPGQLMLIGVLNWIPYTIKDIITPAVFHFSANTPGILAIKLSHQYRFLSIFPKAQSALRALAKAPKPELILNNWVNAEGLSTPGTFEFIAGFSDRLGLPVLNHPSKVVQTTRLKNAERLAGVANLVIPRLIRFANNSEMREQTIRHIGEAVGFPVIIRGLFAQEGIGAEKIDSPKELSRHLATLPDSQLYAIEYIHNPVPEGAYRKMRAAVIGGELFMLNVYFGGLWNVHRKDGGNLRAFDANGTARAFAQKILSRPEEALGKPAMTTLHEIRARTPLDVFGIDFDLLPDGRLLFFEANAAMGLHMREGEDLPETLLGMRTAYRRLFENPPPPPSPGRLD